MKMKQGWISIHRQLQSHWLWDDKPFSKGQAWIDLLLLANHSEKTIMLGNELIDVQTGSFITSELKLMERWGWSKTKVRAFLDVLQKDNMIVKKTDRKKTTIIIENYSNFQDCETTEKPKKDRKKTTKKPQKDTNNNDNNENNENKIIYVADFIEPTRREFEGLEKLRSLCFSDLDEAMLFAINLSISFVTGKGKTLHEQTIKTKAYFTKLIEERKADL